MQGTACPKREIKNSDTGLENLSTSKRKGKFSELPEKKEPISYKVTRIRLASDFF